MAKGFFDIEQQEPERKPEDNALQKYAEDKAEMQEAYQKALQLKAEMLRQMDAGKAPQIILYTAVEAIGLLTNDPGFTEEGQGKIDTIYKDLAQLSFTQDNDEIARKRLKEQEAAYNKTLRNSINRQLIRYRKIERALNDVLTAVDEAERKE
jgi:hypothetical protein